MPDIETDPCRATDSKVLLDVNHGQSLHSLASHSPLPT